MDLHYDTLLSIAGPGLSGRRDDPLVSLSSRLNAPLELEEALRVVCEEAARALEAPVITLDLFDERRELFYPAAAFGLLPAQLAHVGLRPQTHYAAGGSSAPFGVGGETAGLSPTGPKGLDFRTAVPATGSREPAGVLSARQPGEPDDPQHPLDAAGRELYGEWGGRPLARARIERAGQPLGSLNVFSHDAAQQVSPDQLALLRAMAGMAAQGIDHLRLAALAARRLEFAHALQTIYLAITTNQDLHVMLRVCLQQITTYLHVDAADVRLLNSNALQFVVGRGLRSPAWQRAAPRLGEGPAGKAALEGRMYSALDLQHEPQAQVLVSEEGFASAVAVPLVVRGHTLGVLEVFNRAPLDPDPEWLECLQAQARQVAIGVDQASLYEGLERTRVELTLSHAETIECWLRALELRDGLRPAQAKHLAELSVTLAEAAGVPSDDLLHVRRGALLHDVGVLCLPEGLLRKPGPFSETELASMRRHPELARELLSPNVHLQRALDIPEFHHEKWDGSGYPHGLRGERIPLAARVFAVVDVWEALRAHRPHRPAWSDTRALSHIISESGLHFDPRIVDLFRDQLSEGRLAFA